MDGPSNKARNDDSALRDYNPLPIKLLWAFAAVLSLSITLWSWLGRSHPLRYEEEPVHLAISPRCGGFLGPVADINVGLDLKSFDTIVAFGDSYTDGGRTDGGPLPPPILDPPYPLAGGRSTNGKVWVECLADDAGARIMDYAQAGACTDLRLWPSNPRKVDFMGALETFLSQNNTLHPETTLYTIFFGINDFGDSRIDGEDRLPSAADVILNNIRTLASPPTSGRSFLLVDDYGRGVHTAAGELYKQTLFSGLHDLALGINASAPLNVGFADLGRIWDGVLGPNPGYKAFGYTSTSWCIHCDANGCTMDGMCDDPSHYFEWYPGHPSKETMRIMADYIEEVLDQCQISRQELAVESGQVLLNVQIP